VVSVTKTNQNRQYTPNKTAFETSRSTYLSKAFTSTNLKA